MHRLIESFNSRVRNECLNMNQWLTLPHAKVGTIDWKHGYKAHHRHLSLDYQTPTCFGRVGVGHN